MSWSIRVPRLLRQVTGVQRLVVDRERVLGAPGAPRYEHSLNKEHVSRSLILGSGRRGRFLDVGSRDGKLDYLLGVSENLLFDPDFYDRNKREFDARFELTAIDIDCSGASENCLEVDICEASIVDVNPRLASRFDVIYSNNVFEHLQRPWIAAENLMAMLKVGGLCVTIAPMSIRYHESPGDYFRFTHTGLVALFEAAGSIRILESGFDTAGRRNDWNGDGSPGDSVPADDFGGWRENWFAFLAFEKVS